MILIKHKNKNKKTKKHIIIKKRKTRLIIKKRKLRSINKNHSFIKANSFLQKYYVKSKYHLPMFHKIINKNGGGILTNLEEKEFYNNIITVAESPQNVAQNNVIIKKHIDKILEVAHNVVIKFEDKQGRDKKIKISGIDKFIHEILTNIEKYKEISITALNCISLQCVILFTELLRLRDEDKFKILPQNIDTYNKILKLEWDNIDKLVTWDKRYISTYDIDQDLTYDIDKYLQPNIFLSLLGELSLLQIIESYSKEIYICGVSIDYIYADGKCHNPYDFMDHDIIHKGIRGEMPSEVLEAESEFIEHIKSEYSKSNLEETRKKDLYKIVLLLFLIMHERGDEFNLNKTIIMDLNIENTFKNSYTFRCPGRFANIKDLGGLLPDEFKDEKKISSLMIPKICPYFADVCEVFNKEWNTFFKEFNNYENTKKTSSEA